jgi:hypothetical protein
MEVLRQVIGPFGLTQAMFQDVDGGAVTTIHNYEKGITASGEDQARFQADQGHKNGPVDRSAYNADLPARRKEMFQQSEPIISAYTGHELPRDGQTHLDHVRSAKSIETDPRANLFMTPSQRVEMANNTANLVPAESAINQSMQDRDKLEWALDERKKDPGKTNAESFGVDMELLKETKAVSDRHVNAALLKAQIKKQGSELLKTGSQMAVKNALRQAFGVLLHAFVSGSFSELKAMLRDRDNEENLIDRLIAAFKRVMQRVMDKLKEAWHALLEGGAQGFLSNLLTYLINCLVTTSAKVVTIIREGMRGLWQAIKLMLNPPAGMPTLEVARAASKIIAAIVTTSIGMLLQESVKGFISSIPLLLPLADIIAPALTGIITGIITALVVYSLDRLFDWLSASDTELLQACEANAEAQAEIIARLHSWFQEQYRNSQLYAVAMGEYQRIHEQYAIVGCYVDSAVMAGEQTIRCQGAVLDLFEEQRNLTLDLQKQLNESLED